MGVFLRVKASGSMRPVRMAAKRNTKESMNITVTSLGLAVALVCGQAAVPAESVALSYQERIAALEQRKQALADARDKATTESDGDSEGAGDAPKSYLDKISGSLSLKIEPSDAQAPEPAAPEPEKKGFSFSFSDKKPIPAPEPVPEAQPPKVSQSKKEEPNEAPATVEAAPEVKPFSFSFSRKEAKPAEQKPAEPKPSTMDMPVEEKPMLSAPSSTASKPWWERIDELSTPPAEKPAAVKEAPAVPEAPAAKPLAVSPAPAPAPTGPPQTPAAPEAPKSFGFFSAPEPAVEKAPPAKGPAPAPEPAKATKVEAKTVAKAPESSKKRKTNGFKLFAAEMLVAAVIAGLGYTAFEKGEELEGIKAKVDNALLDLGSTK